MSHENNYPENTEPVEPGGSLADGVWFNDTKHPSAYLQAVPMLRSGNCEIEAGVLDDEGEIKDGYFATLTAAQRRILAAVLLGVNEDLHGVGQELGATGKMRVVIETGGDGWSATPEDFDYLWARAGWHVRHGIPGYINHHSGASVSIHEVGDGPVSPRGMSEVRRHYRYRMTPGGEWRLGSNFKAIKAMRPAEMQFQRSYRSEWEDVQ